LVFVPGFQAPGLDAITEIDTLVDHHAVEGVSEAEKPDFAFVLYSRQPRADVHDPYDFEMGNRHNLDRVVVIGGDGTMTPDAGSDFAGLNRFKCRQKVVRMLEEQDLLEKIEEHEHSVGHCYRCDTVIEPALSDQWFVRMKELAEPAIAAALDGRSGLLDLTVQGA